MTGFEVRKVVSAHSSDPFCVKKWQLDEITPYAPTNLQFGILYENSGGVFCECSDHFLRGGEFPTRFSNLFLKKFNIFSWKENLEK